MTEHQDLPAPLGFALCVAIVLAALFGFESGGLGPDAPPTALERMAGHDAPLAPDAPTQRPLAPDASAAVDLGGEYVAHPSHAFEVTALVLSRKRYARGWDAAVSPLDVTLGWGAMSRPDLRAAARVRQSDRFGFVSWPAEGLAAAGLEGNPREIADRVSPLWANMHLVPADDRVAEALGRIREGDVVTLTGVLADISGPRGLRWVTSTTRTDTGGGACEILLVRHVRIGGGTLTAAR